MGRFMARLIQTPLTNRLPLSFVALRLRILPSMAHFLKSRMGVFQEGGFHNSWRVGSLCEEICYCKGVLTDN